MTAGRKKAGASRANPFNALRPGSMGLLQFRLERGLSIDDAHLDEVIRRHGGEPLPPAVAAYVAKRLERSKRGIKGRRGRKPPGNRAMLRKLLIGVRYREYLAWLRRRKKKYGKLPDWPCLEDQPWWDGPLHERAARMMAHRLSRDSRRWPGFAPIDWRRVLNIASSGR